VRHRPGFFVVLASVLLAAACSTVSRAPRPGLVAAIDWSGLEPIDVKGIDIAYASPAADFARYTKVMLDPVEVVFDEGWEPLEPGSAFPIAERDLERLRQDISQLTHETFTRYIARGGQYGVVEEPAPGVLRIRMRVVDLHLNAPDFPTVSRSYQYARSAGEMTLVADLIDGETGALVGRVVDRWVDPEDNWLRWMNRMETNAALRKGVESWAEALKRQLEVASIRNRMQGAGEGIRRDR
jgi:hypothetical protein